MRQRERNARQAALDQRSDRQLVRGIYDRPQQTDRNRLDSAGRHLTEQCDDFRFVERNARRTVAQNALGDLERQRLRHKGRRIRHGEIERVLPSALAKDQGVGMPGGRQKGGARRSSRHDRIDRMRGAVNEDVAARQIIGERGARRVGRDPHDVEEAGDRIGRRRCGLEHFDAAIGTGGDQIGKGAAGVDREAQSSGRARI